MNLKKLLKILFFFSCFFVLSLNNVKAGTHVIGEAGTVGSLDDAEWLSASLTSSYYDSTPLVFVTTQTTGGSSDPSAAHVKNLSTSGFETQHCEYDAWSCDSHDPETNGWLAVDEAKVRNSKGLDAGTTTISGNNTVTVNFNKTFTNTPLVFTQVQTVDGTLPINAKVISKTTSSVDIELCQQNSTDGCNSSHGTETVAWLAIDPQEADKLSTWDWGTIACGDSSWKSISYSLSSTPIVMVTTQTQNGGQEDLIPEATNVSSTGASVRYCEPEGTNDCDTHVDETVAWFAVLQGDVEGTSLDSAPAAPTNLQTNGQTNPTELAVSNPYFSATYSGSPEDDIANKYQIQVDDNSDFSSPIWDSGQTGMTNCDQGTICSSITYNGPSLTRDTTYYWRIKYWDDSGQEGAWSTEDANFKLASGCPTATGTVEYDCSWENNMGTIDVDTVTKNIVGAQEVSDRLNTASITIPEGKTVTVQSDQVVLVGSLDLTGDGSVVIVDGGQIKPGGVLSYEDKDQDGYAANFDNLIKTYDSGDFTPVSNILTTDFTDCDENDSNKWQNLTGYTDNDNDTYTVGDSQQICSGSSLPSGYADTASGSDDCNDDNASVWATLTGYVDNDNDGYGTGTAQDLCTDGSLPSGYADNADDIDDNNDCADNSTTHQCGAGDLDGTCTPVSAGENGLAACQRCNGSSIDPVNVTDDTQDTEGSNLCNQECKKCLSGSCVNQDDGYDTLTSDGDTVYVDCNTNKWWAPSVNSWYTMSDAISYCNNLNYGGKSDWYLPSENVLSSLCNSGSCSGTCFGGDGSDSVNYWSSTECGNGYAFNVRFRDCYVGNDPLTFVRYVRCVR